MRITAAATTDPRELAAFLRGGGIAAVPTDTVYGFIAAAHRADAAQRIYELKGRPEEKKLILLAADRHVVENHATVPAAGQAWAARHWPGPLTLILRSHAGAALGYRVPAHDWLRELLQAFGTPVVSTSANRSGQPPATAAAAVRSAFAGEDLWLVDGGPAPGGVPSTIIDCTVDPPRLLRDGPLRVLPGGKK